MLFGLVMSTHKLLALTVFTISNSLKFSERTLGLRHLTLPQLPFRSVRMSSWLLDLLSGPFDIIC